MKRKIFSILFALVLVVSFSLVAAVPVVATATLEVSKWTESSANPIFDPSEKAYYPTILFDGATYRMWYADETGIRYATSSDGITWAAGVSVTGLTSANHPLVEYYADGFTGADSGDNTSSDTMYYRIWYWPGLSYSINDIRYAESADGTAWYNDQPIQNGAVPVISGGDPWWNRGSYGPADVLYNPGASNTGTDWIFTMYYDGTTGGDESIGLGFSADGIVWTGYDSDVDGKADPVLTGSGSGWDTDYVSRCTVIKGDDGTYRMWFSGGTGEMNAGIGYATSSDGLVWIKDASNPIFHKGDGVSWRDARTYCPVVIEDGGIYKMWFSGKDAGGNYAIGYATNTNPDPDYVTIQAAIDAAVDGGTIIVAAGTYTADGLVADIYKSGLTLQSTDGPEVTIIQSAGEEGDGAVRIRGADDGTPTTGVTIDSFTVYNTGTANSGTGIFIGGWFAGDMGHPAVDNTVQNCIFGSVTDQSLSPTVGVYFWGADGNHILNNQFYQIRNEPDNFGNAIIAWGGLPEQAPVPSRTNLIDGNMIHSADRYGIFIGAGDMTDFSGTRILGNTISNTAATPDLGFCNAQGPIYVDGDNSYTDYMASNVSELSISSCTDDQGPVWIETDRYLSITAAVSAADPEDTISVAAGTYVEAVKIDRELTLKGANAGTPSTGTRGPESIIDVSGFTGDGIKVTADTVTIDGFEIIGITEAGNSSSNVNPTIAAEANYVTVQNCVFNSVALGKEAMVARPGTNHISFLDNKVNNYMFGITARGNGWGGSATLPDDGVTYLTVSGNTFNVGYVDTGTQITGEAVQIQYGDDIVVTGNTINGPGTFESCAYGLINSIGIVDFMSGYGAAGTITYSNNDVTNCYVGIATFAGNGEISGNTVTGNNIGIQVGQNDDVYISTPAEGVAITGNDIQNNIRGIWAQNFVVDGLAAHFNNIVGNTEYGVINEDPENDEFDAAMNWWGDISGPEQTATNPDGLGNEVSANVKYSPWCAAPDDDSVTPGYQAPTPMVWGVSTDGTIQEAIDAASPNDTVIVAAGTYVEAVKIDRELTLKGANAGTPSTGTRGPESIIKPDDTTPTYDGNRRVAVRIQYNGVTVDGFEIDGTDGTVHYGIYAFNSNNTVVKNNIVHDITNKIGAPGFDVAGVGIMAFGWEQGISGTLIEGNTVYITGRMGIIVSAWGPSAWLVCNDNIFRDNTVHDAWQGPTEDYGGAVQINVAKDSLIEGNTIYDTGLDQYGIYIPASVLSANRIVENDIYNNEIGIVIWSDDSVSNYGEGDPGPPEVHYNNIYNNTDRGLQVTDTDPVYEVDAEDNWWGTLIGSEIAEMVSGNVDYSPWLDAPYPDGESTSLDVTTISLASGWNLISLPLIPKDPTIGVVLDGIPFQKVAGYSPFQDWKFYTPGVPGNLDQMNDGWGYWVDMETTTATLTVKGYEFCKPAPNVPPAYDLVPGWNLIGFKSLSPIAAGTYLGELEPVMRAMYGYDTTSDVYTVILATTDLVPGKGYWLAVSEAGTIYPFPSGD